MDYEEKCIEEYILKTDKILFTKIFIDHDGYDYMGPKSDLFSFLIIIRRNNKILYEIFHRDNYWDGVIEYYRPSNYYIEYENNYNHNNIFSCKLPEKHKDFIYYDENNDLFKLHKNVKRKRWLNDMLRDNLN